jgi:hypothetical protein
MNTNYIEAFEKINSGRSGNGHEVARETDISSQLSAQNKLTSEVLEYAKRLEERLLPLLRATGPTAAMDKAPKDQIVPLADVLRSNNERIAEAIGTLNSILQRLEL